MTDDSIGVDISKAYLDVHRLEDGAFVQFENTKQGFAALNNWIGADAPTRVVYEATGPFHSNFERAFQGKLPLVKVNPLQARRFAQANGTRAKTDKADAAMLAKMGSALNLQPDKPKAEDHRILKELQITRQALIKEQTRLKNRLQTQTLALTKRQTKARLQQIIHQLKQLDEAIKNQISACPKREKALRIVQSIPGIGATTAATILIEMPEIGTLSNKAAACLAGLAPITRNSGQWKGKAFIQGGRKTLRDSLYMPALVAMRYNPDLAKKYQKMKQNGKPAKLILTAIMRKLLILANTIVKQDRKWIKNSA